jgi:hypothetical protein
MSPETPGASAAIRRGDNSTQDSTGFLHRRMIPCAQLDGIVHAPVDALRKFRVTASGSNSGSMSAIAIRLGQPNRFRHLMARISWRSP